jgi:hypothetical protein
MRNSLVPLVGVLIVAAAAVMLISDSQPIGFGGPEINAGIYRVPKRGAGVIESLDALKMTNDVTVESQADHSVGVEPEQWHSVTLASADGEPLTRAAILALAEEFARRDLIALVLPQREMPLPIASDRIIRVATRSATIPEGVGGECAAELTVEVSAPRFPSGHPAARLEGASSSRPMTLSVRHQSSGAPDAPWSRWYATVGRGIATAAITAMGAQDFRFESAEPRAEWENFLPQPPLHAVVRWHGAMQDDLVRGWFGEIRGTTTLDKAGAEASALAPLEKLLKSGMWEESSVPGAALRTWSRERDGTMFWFGCQSMPTGWQLTMWQERSEPSRRFDEWFDSAQVGDAAARRNLRRHLLCASIPDAQRLEAATLLKQNPSAAESAMIAAWELSLRK